MLGAAEEDTRVDRATERDSQYQTGDDNQRDNHRSSVGWARAALDRLIENEALNFVLTNRVPRRLLTRLVRRISAVEQPVIRDWSLRAWQLFAGPIDWHDAKKTHFSSLHDCFVRELKDGARPIDFRPDIMVSPCDGIVGASGTVAGTELLQVKGSPYTLNDLIQDRELIESHRGGTYVTLRLTSTMYHRFHAPADCDVERVLYMPGDLYNVNRAALRRVPRLFCRNERAVIATALHGSSERITLVAVGAILVGSIRLRFLPQALDARYDGPRHLACGATLRKGEEMGYFQHGSTIIVLATPGMQFGGWVHEGSRIRMGEPLLAFETASEASRSPGGRFKTTTAST
jgi:phosphatidylserine decarboxylase